MKEKQRENLPLTHEQSLKDWGKDNKYYHILCDLGVEQLAKRYIERIKMIYCYVIIAMFFGAVCGVGMGILVMM